MSEQVYKVATTTDESPVGLYFSSGVGLPLEREYRIGETIYPLPGTPGLFAFRTLEDAREYAGGNDVIFLAETSEIVGEPPPMILRRAMSLEQTAKFWANPTRFMSSLLSDTPRGSILCVDLKLLRPANESDYEQEG